MWPCWQLTMMSSIIFISHDLSQPIKIGWETEKHETQKTLRDAPVTELGVWSLKIKLKIVFLKIYGEQRKWDQKFWCFGAMFIYNSDIYEILQKFPRLQELRQFKYGFICWKLFQIKRYFYKKNLDPERFAHV